MCWSPQIHGSPIEKRKWSRCGSSCLQGASIIPSVATLKRSSLVHRLTTVRGVRSKSSYIRWDQSGPFSSFKTVSLQPADSLQLYRHASLYGPSPPPTHRSSADLPSDGADTRFTSPEENHSQLSAFRAFFSRQWTLWGFQTCCFVFTDEWSERAHTERCNRGSLLLLLSLSVLAVAFCLRLNTIWSS